MHPALPWPRVLVLVQSVGDLQQMTTAASDVSRGSSARGGLRQDDDRRQSAGAQRAAGLVLR
jgi:hypothetical protein